MIKDLVNNLSKNQKIGVLVVAQILVIALLWSLISVFMTPKDHVVIEEGSVSEMDLPSNVASFVGQNIWQVVMRNVSGVTKDDIDDVVIREGTYVEEVQEDGSIKANFIVDIDSLKQTYTVSTGWSKNASVVYEVTVDCPPQNMMKYPETICYGMYNNTYSLDLYLPYVVRPEETEGEESIPLAPDYLIVSGEEENTINIIVSVCDVDKFKKEAMDYLKSTPIKLDEYKINYEINKVDVGC